MKSQTQRTRRIAGLLRSRLPELHLERVADPRSRRGRRWKHLSTLLRAALVGIMAGSKSLANLESLTDEMSVSTRRMLRIGRRVPDTTMRHMLIKLDPDELRLRLHGQIKTAHRRKALAPLGLPFGQVALDGRSTALPDVAPDKAPKGSDGKWAEQFAQRCSQSGGHSYRLMRTITCTLVSARAKPCLDAVPIPAKTNEMGHFATVIRDLAKVYKRSRLFRLVSADAGNCSLANAHVVTQRSEDCRQTPWKTVIRWVYNMLIAAQPNHLEGLRDRKMALAGV